MSITRRQAIKTAAALGATLAWPSLLARAAKTPRTERRDLFPQGVASGDPQPDSVLLWTRHGGRPPQPYAPVGAEFITGSISAPTLFEGAKYNLPKELPWRTVYLHDKPGGGIEPAINLTLRHGVRASLALCPAALLRRRVAGHMLTRRRAL